VEEEESPPEVPLKSEEEYEIEDTPIFLRKKEGSKSLEQ
jgi:hypothetical protein